LFGRTGFLELTLELLCFGSELLSQDTKLLQSPGPLSLVEDEFELNWD